MGLLASSPAQGVGKAALLGSELSKATSLMMSVESDVALAWKSVRALTDADIVGLHTVLDARIAGAEGSRSSSGYPLSSMTNAPEP